MKLFSREVSVKDFLLMTISGLLLAFGTWFFKYPNNFSMGGVTGISIVLSKLINVSAGSINLVVNFVLMLMGIILLGKEFAGKTIYVTTLFTVVLSYLDKFHHIDSPVTSQPLMELFFAVGLSGVASAILFNIDASSGGTDIIAMILKKYSGAEIGTALLVVDFIITISTFFVFNIETGLLSLMGLLIKTLVLDSAIENINLCKYVTVISTNPSEICDFIHSELNRSATVYKAEGSYSHTEKTVIMTVMKRRQAVKLRQFVKTADPNAFIMITNSSEIIGKGFRGFN